MLRSANTGTILCEEQSRFILERIDSVEKHFSELCGAFADFTRKCARLREKSDELAHVAQEYSAVENYNKSLSNGMSSLSKALTLIGDFQDLEVKRLESRIVSELSQYELVCKHCKDSVKDAILTRDKELAKRKQLDQARARNVRGKKSAKDAELIKSNLDVSKSMKAMEEIVGRFEKQKLVDLKSMLMDFVMIELKFHTNAVEVLSATYQDISDIDENKDYQQFKKYLQQDEHSDRYFLQRIKSQSMGALSSMFAATSAGGRKNKSSSSNSLNSSQEQEQHETSAVVQDPLRILTANRKGNSEATLQRSSEFLDSKKHDLSDDSKESTDESDSDEDSDSATDSDDVEPKQQPQPTKVDPNFTIIKLKDYN
ncbi:CBY1-interacting BAR domain-containing protein 1-A isoform X2 [Toxorhynchites rutilus septentrionalis]|uniref:CBY1-interacting BAR domain-containing protein 1-A isoform X2 n=1 Tax=Toxorhynchites rutilus septentrionalis TaxID=329112 RepID=UPI00247AEDB7|nr:CBY1-interacting BAR domain-containing protein 1-A isoform X2 [Toxorhynchites rutilus septentrionalis]